MKNICDDIISNIFEGLIVDTDFFTVDLVSTISQDFPKVISMIWINIDKMHFAIKMQGFNTIPV